MALNIALSSMPSIRLAMTEDYPDEPRLVAFDFDGTLTVRDSFMAFLKWRAGGFGYAMGMIRLSPAALAYLFHRKRGVIKAAAIKVFLKGVPREKLEADAKAFAQEIAPNFFRPDALAVWKRWRSKHATMVICTASPEILVAPFARGLGCDTLIGTELRFDDNNRVQGGILGQNCRGPEKVRRLRAVFGDDMDLAAAYGDTRGDREMLQIATEKGYRIFKGKSG